MGQGGGEGDGLYTIPADSIGLKSLLFLEIGKVDGMGLSVG